jgi:hypothetical protein
MAKILPPAVKIGLIISKNIAEEALPEKMDQGRRTLKPFLPMAVPGLINKSSQTDVTNIHIQYTRGGHGGYGRVYTLQTGLYLNVPPPAGRF